MDSAIFYTKEKEGYLEVWAKIISKNNDIIDNVKLDNNSDYGSISDWKTHDLEFHDTYSEFSNELYRLEFAIFLKNRATALSNNLINLITFSFFF